MFALIITIISITLVATLAIASIYYGGTVLSQGSAKTQASTIVNQSQQLASAIAVYEAQNNGAAPTQLSDLDLEYIQTVPTPPSSASGTYRSGYPSILLNVNNEKVCLTIDQTEDPAITKVPSWNFITPYPYGCETSEGSTPYVFYYLTL